MRRIEAQEQESAEAKLSRLPVEDVKELVTLLNGTDIAEIHIELDGAKISIKRDIGRFAQSMRDEEFTPVEKPQLKRESEGVTPDHLTVITAPMVGIFYASSKPDGEPFVQEGELVEKRQTIGVIEAMKMMNEIESDEAGKIVEILVKNGQAVEYGQPLMVMEPLQAVEAA
ncbi:MAG: acetyl-CoA carboxylase biotin carboxyl carrier protein [Chloroflexi bacterium]|nr:acetyl-CoA carboxylase biotin carboxyl carrier protein [Chloroflexota bacterium]